jgi:uncharacterized membrane protein YcjF (UPF0283 family)
VLDSLGAVSVGAMAILVGRAVIRQSSFFANISWTESLTAYVAVGIVIAIVLAGIAVVRKSDSVIRNMWR